MKEVNYTVAIEVEKNEGMTLEELQAKVDAYNEEQRKKYLENVYSSGNTTE
jgi:hypothetical protein